MTDVNVRGKERDKPAKVAFGVMSIFCLVAGLVLYVFAEDFGISPGMASFIAIAFLAAGVSDYLVLRFWDRMRKRR